MASSRRRAAASQHQPLVGAEALAADPDRNQSKAARAAGAVKDAAVRGARLARVVKVQRYLAALGDAAERSATKGTHATVLSARKILEMLSDQARASMADFLRIDEGPVCAHCGRGGNIVVLDLAQGIQRGKGHLVHRYSPGGRRGTGESLTLVDSTRALDKLGRIYRATPARL